MVSKIPLVFLLLVIMTTVYASKHVKYTAFGKRDDEDHKVEEKRVDVSGKFFRFASKLISIKIEGKRVITQIRVYKRGVISSRPKAKLIFGGPGFRFATLYLKSPLNRGLHAIIEVYAKRGKYGWQKVNYR